MCVVGNNETFALLISNWLFNFISVYHPLMHNVSSCAFGAARDKL